MMYPWSPYTQAEIGLRRRQEYIGRHARKRGKAKNCWTPPWPLAQMFHWPPLVLFLPPTAVLSIPSLIIAPSLRFSPNSQKSSLQSHNSPPSLIRGNTLCCSHKLNTYIFRSIGAPLWSNRIQFCLPCWETLSQLTRWNRQGHYIYK